MYKVVIVDDDVEMLLGLEKIIAWEEHGCQITGKARNGAEALEIARACPPDILITDITMPVISGLDLIKEVKKLKSDIKTVLLTCHEDFIFAQEAIKLDVDDYIVKYMLTPQDMLKTISKLKTRLDHERKFGPITRLIQNDDPLKAADYRAEIKKILDYVHAHLDEDLSCEAMAAYINMNASYFSRLFKSQTGSNFSDYIAKRRMEHATALLLNSDLTVEEIASAIGIDNPSYFYRVYKKSTGITPGDLRKRR